MLAVMRVLMAKPAASSFAELMRTPVDKRSMAVSCARPVLRKELWAANALMFVLIDVDMDFLLQGVFTKLQEIQFEILLLADSVSVEITLVCKLNK
jgi:hypothetical protein